MITTLSALEIHASDPANLGWPSTLPVEIALRMAPLPDIREAYGITWEEWEELRINPSFRKAVVDAQEKCQEEGFSFKTKARMQAEALLATSWKLIQDAATPAAVKADLIKFTTRVAGYDAPKGVAGEGGGGFQININLGAPAEKTIAVSHTFDQLGEPA